MKFSKLPIIKSKDVDIDIDPSFEKPCIKLQKSIKSIIDKFEESLNLKLFFEYDITVDPYEIDVFQYISTSRKRIPIQDAIDKIKVKIDKFIRTHERKPVIVQRYERETGSTIGVKMTTIDFNGFIVKSVANKIHSFGHAHILGKVVPHEEISRRIEICKGCTYSRERSGNLYCGQCGCGFRNDKIIGNLAAFEETKKYGCPLNKWKKEEE